MLAIADFYSSSSKSLELFWRDFEKRNRRESSCSYFSGSPFA